MCGIFGVFNHEESVRLAYLGLYALQHRGQESAGIAAGDGKILTCYKDMGLAADVFTKGVLSSLRGTHAIGHVRYSTTGSSLAKNAQPFMVKTYKGAIAIGHNGNLINSESLRRQLEKSGSIFQSTMDSEIFLQLMARARKGNVVDDLIWALLKVRGAYSIVLATEDKLIAARDPRGFRPLCIGMLNDTYVVSSETCALDLIQAKYVREVEPGEIVVFDKEGLHSHKPFPVVRHAHCIFELIYFARPDSNVFGMNVYETRKKLGRRLAKEAPSKGVDFVMPIPDSGTYAALGYAQQSKLPFEMGFIRNHYIGRTFIQPAQNIRDFAVKIKLNPVRDLPKDKSIAVVEDSIVRGTTSRARVKSLRDAGAKEIHMRISCPPHRHPCYFGIDFPTEGELIANKSKNVAEISKFLGLDSLAYLSHKGMLDAMSFKHNKLCTACFSGKYCIRPEESMEKGRLEDNC